MIQRVEPVSCGVVEKHLGLLRRPHRDFRPVIAGGDLGEVVSRFGDLVLEPGHGGVGLTRCQPPARDLQPMLQLTPPGQGLGVLVCPVVGLVASAMPKNHKLDMPWPTSPRRILALTCLAGAVLTLAACGSGSGSKSASGTGATPVASTTPSQSPTTASTSAGTSGSLACPTAAALSSATGVSFPTPIVAPNGNGTNVCEYNLGDTSPTILIGTDLTRAGVTAGTFDNNGAPAVAGYGEAAWITQSGGTTTMQILNGQYTISITSNQSESVVEKAARLVLSQ